MVGFGNCSHKQKKYSKTKIFLVLLLIFFCFFTSHWWRGIGQSISEIKGSGRTTIFLINPENVQQINTRRSYYSNALLGKIFENKITFIFDKWKKNLFQALDLNYYFFANHPRERAGVTEREMFSWYWLPIFLVGLYLSLKSSLFIHNLIFIGALCVIGLFNHIDNFVIFLIPLLMFNIFLGLKRIFFE